MYIAETGPIPANAPMRARETGATPGFAALLDASAQMLPGPAMDIAQPGTPPPAMAPESSTTDTPGTPVGNMPGPTHPPDPAHLTEAFPPGQTGKPTLSMEVSEGTLGETSDAAPIPMTTPSVDTPDAEVPDVEAPDVEAPAATPARATMAGQGRTTRIAHLASPKGDGKAPPPIPLPSGPTALASEATDSTQAPVAKTPEKRAAKKDDTAAPPPQPVAPQPSAAEPGIPPFALAGAQPLAGTVSPAPSGTMRPEQNTDAPGIAGAPGTKRTLRTAPAATPGTQEQVAPGTASPRDFAKTLSAVPPPFPENRDAAPALQAQAQAQAQAQGSALQSPVPQTPAAAPTASPSPPAPAASARVPVVAARAGVAGRAIGVEIARRVQEGGDALRVRLRPVELGNVEVTMRFDDKGLLRATVRAENPAALDLLRRDAPELARALDQAGVRADGQSLRFENGTAGQQQNGRTPFPYSPAASTGASPESSGNAGEWATDGAEPADGWRTLRGTGRIDMIA